MRTTLTYTHTRNLFTGSEFKPFVEKYFKDVRYLGTETGNWSPEISVSNWEDVKYELPKYAVPTKVRLDENISILDALSHGQLGLARKISGENNVKYKSIKVWN